MSYGNHPGDPGGYGGQPGGYGQPDGYGHPGGYDSSGGYGQPGGYGAYGAAGGYGHPGYPPSSGRTNGMAIASLVTGLIGLLLCGVTAILGVIFGHVSLSQIKRTGEDGRGMAIAGLVISYFSIAAWVLFAILWLGLFGAVVSTSGYY